MADTIRHKIIDSVKAMLAAISIANGYTTDFVTVEDWRIDPFEPSDLPAINITDSDESITESYHCVAERKLSLQVDIFLKGSEAPRDARNIIQDIYKCLHKDESCGGYARNLIPTTTVLQMERKDNNYGYIVLGFDVIYATDTWDLTVSIS